ncbi:hypothetical protein GGI17_001354 [Coemansia sp. S146]|nr:hypothetical protein GGI17_001354 [Coemansia sp. S146]
MELGAPDAIVQMDIVAVATEEQAVLPVPGLATSVIATLEQRQRLSILADSEQLPTQPKRNSLILLRKPAMSNTAPRVPSTLRLVVDVGAAVCPEDYVSDDSDNDDITAVANTSATAATTASSSMTPTRQLSIVNTLQPIPLASQMPSPILRRDNSHGPMLANLIDKPVDRSKCLPYPHTMDCYTPRPRPHSLNTLSSVSCRLSIVTLDQEYQEYSFKKNAQVSVRPSAVRGWMKMFRGKVKVRYVCYF